MSIKISEWKISVHLAEEGFFIPPGWKMSQIQTMVMKSMNSVRKYMGQAQVIIRIRATNASALEGTL